MRSKTSMRWILEFVIALAKVEAMRGANDARRYMNLPPAYEVKDFKNCVNFIQNAETAIDDGDASVFLKNFLKGKEQAN